MNVLKLSFDVVFRLDLININPKNTLNELYKHIGCDLVTLVEFECNGKYYDAWIDDEGLLKNKPIPTLLINNEDMIEPQMLFGTIIFAKNKNGNMIGLTQEDIENLQKFIAKSFNNLKKI